MFTGVTALLGMASSIVGNKIDDLANTGRTDLQMDEVNRLSEQLSDVARKGKDVYNAHKR